MKLSSYMGKAGKALALAWLVTLGATFMLGSTTASATLVNIVITPTGGTAAGSGTGDLDKGTLLLTLDSFSFVGQGKANPEAPFNIKQNFTLDWATFSVLFTVNPKLKGDGVAQFGGTYADTNATDSIILTGTWVLQEPTSVPEPGSLALLGGVLVALGLARRFRRKA